jgi:opacity protein-like surface antigen
MKSFKLTVAIIAALACQGVCAADAVATRALPMPNQLQAPPQISLQQQVSALQQQVAILQSQLAAVLAAVQVTPAGVTLQGPSVTIAGGFVKVRAQNDLTLETATNLSLQVGVNLNANVGANTALRTGSNLALGSGSGTTMRASSVLDLYGSTIRLNGGTKPLAIVGSQVQSNVNGQQAQGQVVTGSQTVLSD